MVNPLYLSTGQNLHLAAPSGSYMPAARHITPFCNVKESSGKLVPNKLHQLCNIIGHTMESVDYLGQRIRNKLRQSSKGSSLYHFIVRSGRVETDFDGRHETQNTTFLMIFDVAYSGIPQIVPWGVQVFRLAYPQGGYCGGKWREP